jgi:hypothetical protein
VTCEGNRCGHDPTRPRWFSPPEKHANRPGVLRKLSERIREYYVSPQKILPGLNAVNESDRQQRSERREACIALLGCILHYTELVTLRVGIPQPDGSFQGLTMEFLAEVSGLGERRAERAVHDLKAAGIITVHPIAQRIEDCTYKGIAAIRTVSRHLFTVFGLGRWLEHERRKAKERRDKKMEKHRRKAQGHIRMAMNTRHDPKPKPEPETGAAGDRKNGMIPAAEFFAGIRASLKGRGPPA